MWQRALSGNGGGTSLNPTDVDGFIRVYGKTTPTPTTTNYTIDLTKKYLLTVMGPNQNVAGVNGGTWFINNGALSLVWGPQVEQYPTLLPVSISGTTLSVTLNWTQLYFGISLIQLD